MNRAPWLTLLLLPLLLAACDDVTEIDDLGTLEPRALIDAVDALFAPLAASEEALDNLSMALEAVRAQGVEFRLLAPAAPARSRALVALGAATAAPLPVSFPPEATAKTFVYDLDSGGWVVDETRTDAPSDGVRVVWYRLDAANVVHEPVEERGYIDLAPGEDATLDAVDMEVVRTAAPAGTLLSLTQGYRETDESGVETVHLEAEGFFADSVTRVDFSLASDEAETTASGDVAYSVLAVLESEETRYELAVDGSADGTTQAFEDAFDAAVVWNGVTTELDLVIAGAGQTRESATGSLVHGGQTIANIGLSGNVYTFTDPDGAEFSSARSTELSAVVMTMVLNGLLLTLELPILSL